MSRIVVSRHPATIQFVADWLGGTVDGDGIELDVSTADESRIPIVATATRENVAGKVVIGNVPLHIASAAAAVYAVEFEGAPPRGQEYTVEDMRAHGAHIHGYRVERTTY